MLDRMNYGACLIFLPLALSTTLLFSQDLTVSGIIRDQNTYQELRAVNVFVKGTQIGTTSDFSGKYTLTIPRPSDDMIVVFQHIAYVKQEIPVDELRNLTYVNLQPRVIPLSMVEIEEEGVRRPEIDKDLPQTVSVIESRNFEIRGYADAGDLLRIDHSVQVDEALSGEKTVSIRGGNPDEVVVLYNGVKLNNAYDNVFDLSLIDLEDIDRFELIKGSNTALYGPEAFSGVINIVPKIQYDYNIRFQQRLGTYRSGNWGLHLYKKFDNISGSYSLKRGAQSRRFVDAEGRLENSSLHHTATINYDLPEDYNGESKGTLSAMWVFPTLDHDGRKTPVENNVEIDTVDTFNNLFSLKYSGQLFSIKDIEASFSFKKLEEEVFFTSFKLNEPQPTISDTMDIKVVDRDIKDKGFYFNAQKEFKFSKVDWLFAYQFELSELDFLDIRRGFKEEVQIGLESADLERRHHGLVSILKYHGETGSDFLQTIDFDASFRHDIIHDSQDNTVLRNATNEEVAVGRFDRNRWNESMAKFALEVSGFRNDLFFNSYLNFGSNTKFPTLYQQVSAPLLSGSATAPNLNPERNRSFELGLSVTRDVSGRSGIYGWQVSANYFQNYYDNKFRIFTFPRIPVVFYDNVKDASVSGFEGKVGVFLFRKKISVDLGLSKYFLSEKAAFPFKSDHKRTLTFNVNHAGYSFQIFWFHESEQIGWLRPFEDSTEVQDEINEPFTEVPIDAFTNLDVHISKTFKIADFAFFINASGRNLLSDAFTLEGLAIRDRRYYLTLGAQY